MKNKYKILPIIFVLFSLMITFSISIQATDESSQDNVKIISMVEAVNKGIEKNYKIKKVKEEVNNIELQINKVEAETNWKFSLASNLFYKKGEQFQNTVALINRDDLPLSNDNGGQTDLTLTTSKYYLSGLSISSNFSLTETEPFEFDDLDDKNVFSVNITNPIYPRVPTESSKQLMNLKDNLKSARDKLNKVMVEQKIKWLNDYLQIVRMKKSKALAQKRLELSENNLANIKNKIKIGEAGRNALLASRISLKEAKLSLKQIEKEISYLKNSLYQSLNLNDEQGINFVRDSKYLKNMSTIITGNKELSDMNLLVDKLNNNNELKNLHRQLRRQKKEMDWIKVEDKVNIKAIANYNDGFGDNNKDWGIGVDLSWDIFDGGKHETKLEEKRNEIESIKNNIKNTREQLHLTLESKLEDLNILQMQLETEIIKVKKAKLQKNNALKKYKKDIINNSQYEKAVNNHKQMLLNKQELKDRILITKLQILNLVGIKKLDKYILN